MDWFIGATGRSFFDVWTVAHFGFWLFICSTLWAFHLNKWVALGCCTSLALVWEGFERYAERRWTDIWFNPESWWNAWLSDPLTAVIGVLGMYWLLDRYGKRRA